MPVITPLHQITVPSSGVWRMHVANSMKLSTHCPKRAVKIKMGMAKTALRKFTRLYALEEKLKT
nr:hypothetical protein [Bathymodiolus platifrons methanotrophic gill symbiont]